jgi:hypothetical protein
MPSRNVPAHLKNIHTTLSQGHGANDVTQWRPSSQLVGLNSPHVVLENLDNFRFFIPWPERLNAVAAVTSRHVEGQTEIHDRQKSEEG